MNYIQRYSKLPLRGNAKGGRGEQLKIITPKPAMFVRTSTHTDGDDYDETSAVVIVSVKYSI